MYNGIQKIEEVIAYIESHITADLDYHFMAKKMNLSVYEFRRIFSFVVGCPISEYIRKRRLSLAALEIMTCDKPDMMRISEKYGYSNQSAFTRAFCEHHGASPSACLQEKAAINLFTRPKFELSVCGRESIPFKIITTTDFFIKGFEGLSKISDSCCCEDVWNAFYENGTDKTLQTEKIYVSYHNQGDDVLCCIGEKAENGVKIPASKWACFTLTTVDDDFVNGTYGKILYEWLPSANLKKNDDLPVIEVYPFDMEQDGFEWDIRIPIE